MKHECVQDLFSQAARKFSSRVAIDNGHRRITYGELEAKAEGLSQRLRFLGASKGSIVGLLTGDPIEVIAAILGTLKAGSVFCPFDPSFPEKRLEVMVGSVSPRLFITESRFLGALKKITSGLASAPKVILIDEGRADAVGLEIVRLSDQRESSNLEGSENDSDPDAPCSIYFTSGSTGRPKAILGRLKGIDHFVRWEIEALGVEAGTRVSQLASPSFDGFLKDAFVPLCAGGVVCAPSSREIVLQAGRLIDWLDVEQVQVLHCVPSVFRSLINEGLDGRYFEALKYVVLAGEALLPADVKRWVDVFGERIKLVNLYGPTETSILKLFYFVKAADIQRASIPIGKPMKGAAALIIDKRGQPCSVGDVGEIYIRTPYRAIGYFGEPELTKEVFVQNPFSSDPSDIVYKTGDYGRLLDDGNLEFLGRRDQQVKVRGVRVEIGEIENLLREQESVKDVAVIEREDAGGNNYLCAYVVINSKAGIEEVREYLAERLPEAMMPSAFIKMEEMPRTLNGKIDRKALPLLDEVKGRQDETEGGGRSPVEEIVAGIWSGVLGLEQISRKESFFNLGGHSLLVTQVISRIREALQVELPLRILFEKPTIEELSEEIEKSRGTPLQLLLPPIEKVSREENLALSFAQQRLWFLDRLGNGSAAYNVPLAFRIDGALDIEALELTLSEIVRRHELLRTSFPMAGEGPAQVIAPLFRVKLEVEDFSHLPETDRARETRKLAAEEARKPFDLSRGPLMRARLLRLAEQEYVILITLHHIVCDGWSMGVLGAEVNHLYERYADGREPDLEELNIQYADYAAWQREWLKGEILEEQLSYWKEQLGGDLPPLELPTDRRRPAVQSHRGATEKFRLNEELSQALKRLTLREGTTLYMTLLAAFQLLLYRYSGQEQILVGTPIANRGRKEIEKLIGFFVNTLVMKADLSGEPSFLELLKRVREVALGAYAHQDVPFENLVEALQPDRDLSRAPVFQVIFTLQNAPWEELRLQGLSISPVEFDSGTSKYDLVLNIWEDRNELRGTLEYNTDLFEQASISRMLRHFENLLQAVATYAEQRIADLPLLTEDELKEMLFDWNNTGADYGQGACAHHLFEQQSEITAGAPAVINGDRLISYGELDNRANQLAHYLQSFDAGLGSRVGILLEHSIETLIALLGTLKAGASYIPLDPQHPPLRLAYMLTDAEAEIVITTRDLAERISGYQGKIVCLDEEWSQIAAQSTRRVESRVTADDIAYVLYTSGSTGQPKGVQIKHRSMVNYLCWAKDTYLRGERMDFALYTSLAFDLTVTSLYTPLISGNAIIVYVGNDTEQTLKEILTQGRAGVLKLTPSHLSLIRGRDYSASGLRRLIVGGEALETQLAKDVSESFGGNIEIYNEYGPTEATVGCMVYRYDPDRDQRVSVPIGRPGANVQIYVLDERLQAVAENVRGEIYIGGEGLAEGYAKRADLTAERFLPNPYGSAMGERLYRTGDGARRLASGEIEYLGRRDEQVKYHGFRVELGEIRGEVNKHPLVRDSVIVMRKDEADTPVLVCYYVARQEIEAGELRRHLSERLIKETIPSMYVHLTKLPLTRNGKVNYEALPGIEWVKEEAGQKAERARTPTEEILCGIWESVLRAKVGIQTNFFEVGGHSLLATQVIARVSEAFNVELPLRSMFEAATVEQQALLIQQHLRLGNPAQQQRQIIPVDRTGQLPLSFSQQRMWFLQQLASGTTAYHMPLGVRLKGRLNLEALRQTLGEIVRRHENLRTVFPAVNGRPTAKIKQANGIEMAIVDLSTVREEGREAEARRVTQEETERRFELSEGPLVRPMVIRMSQREHIVICTMHHIICDGWSLEVITREMSRVYESYRKGEETRLEELRVQYADYAGWQREWLKGEEKARRVEYWREKMKEAPAGMKLPQRKRRGRVQSYKGAREEVRVSKELVEKLREMSRREGVTMYMTMLTGYVILLNRYTGEEEVVVGTVIANREDREVEKLIGYVANTMMLRVGIREGGRIRELLREVREECLGGYTNQIAPEVLIEEGVMRVEEGRERMYEVWFQMEREKREKLELGEEVESEWYVEGREDTRMEMSMMISERDNELIATVEYDSDVFTPRTITRMIKGYITLLEMMVIDPDRKVTTITLTSEEETEQLSSAFTASLEL